MGSALEMPKHCDPPTHHTRFRRGLWGKGNDMLEQFPGHSFQETLKGLETHRTGEIKHEA